MNRSRERKFRALAYALLISAALPLSQAVNGAVETGSAELITPALAVLPGLIVLLGLYRSFLKRPRRYFAGNAPARSNRFLMVVAAMLTSFVVASRPIETQGADTSESIPRAEQRTAEPLSPEHNPLMLQPESPIVTDDEDLATETVIELLPV